MSTQSRRTILTAAAWSAPAVALAAAAPAYATSGPPPEPVCDVTAWRTNHGHKGHPKPRPGTHHYHLTVACASTVRAVWIAGVEATYADGVWTAHHIRGGVHQPVTILTDEGTVSRTVRFQPEKPGGKR